MLFVHGRFLPLKGSVRIRGGSVCCRGCIQSREEYAQTSQVDLGECIGADNYVPFGPDAHGTSTQA